VLRRTGNAQQRENFNYFLRETHKAIHKGKPELAYVCGRAMAHAWNRLNPEQNQGVLDPLFLRPISRSNDGEKHANFD
jgi:hypothetical protein